MIVSMFKQCIKEFTVICVNTKWLLLTLFDWSRRLRILVHEMLTDCWMCDVLCSRNDRPSITRYCRGGNHIIIEHFIHFTCLSIDIFTNLLIFHKVTFGATSSIPSVNIKAVRPKKKSCVSGNPTLPIGTGQP